MATAQKDKWAFASEGGTLYACCADHGFTHDTDDDAHICFWEYEMTHCVELQQPKEFPLSACALPHCLRQTDKALSNGVIPTGKYLCDVHRRPAVLMSLLPFGAGEPGAYKMVA